MNKLISKSRYNIGFMLFGIDESGVRVNERGFAVISGENLISEAELKDLELQPLFNKCICDGTFVVEKIGTEKPEEA
jgi:hypothetical protein